jgi:hypothetical protein
LRKYGVAFRQCALSSRFGSWDARQHSACPRAAAPAPSQAPATLLECAEAPPRLTAAKSGVLAPGCLFVCDRLATSRSGCVGLSVCDRLATYKEWKSGLGVREDPAKLLCSTLVGETSDNTRCPPSA